LAKNKLATSGGIKPLNAPRTIHVRIDSAGNPTSIQVPPTIDSPRARRTSNRKRRNAPKRTASPTAQFISDGKWMKVAEIENLWKVNDEWWRGPDEEIARLYYVLRLESGQQLTVYLDLTTNDWYRQAG